jgi:hypothetical protein
LVGRKKYYVSFIDDYSKFTWVYLIMFKSEVFVKFQEFQTLVEHLFNRKIIALQTVGGGEYQKLNSFFTKIGITHLVSCPHTHQQNGAAERKYRHIVEVGLSLLAHASKPLKFWDEAFISTAYLIKRLPSLVINHTTPLECLFHQSPDYSSLRVFGCACGPNLRPYNTHKLAFRSKQCIFLGYTTLHKGYKCLDVDIGRVYVSRDVVFDKKLFPFADMHKNAGARLKSEISCLHPTLLNHCYGGIQVDDQCEKFPAENDNDLVSDGTQEAARNSNVHDTENEADPLIHSVAEREYSNLFWDPCQEGSMNCRRRHRQRGSRPRWHLHRWLLLRLHLRGNLRHQHNHLRDQRPLMFRLMRFRMVAVNQPQVQVHLDERDLLWNLWPKTRLQSGIRKAKVYTDETVKYGCFSTTGESDNLVEALYDKKLERSYECRI